MAAGDSGMYGIGTVVRKTGLNAATIRSWELRYGAVVPQRTPSGRRLYSARQVRQLAWLAEQIRRGLQSGEAHRLLTEWEDEEAAPIMASPPGADGGFEAWLDRSEPEIRGAVAEAVRASGLVAAVVGVNRHHPVFGMSNAAIAAASGPGGGRALAAVTDLTWSLLPEAAGTLGAGRSAIVAVDELDPVGAARFRPAQVTGLVFAPMAVGGVWTGTVSILMGDAGRPGRQHVAIAGALRDLVLAHHALSAALADSATLDSAEEGGEARDPRPEPEPA